MRGLDLTGLDNTDVYSIDGHLIGKIAEAWPSQYASSGTLARVAKEAGRGYFRLSGFKGGDLFVPIAALADITDERVKIRYTKGQIAKQGWNQRPADLPRD